MPVSWNRSLEIGVPEIDHQHRELFARLGGFDDALARGDRADIAATFAFLRDYALVHFEREERLMREAEYPRLEAHQALHQGFVARLQALSREHELQGPSALLRLRARNWIVVWLTDHVGGEDVALGRHLTSRAA
ncbi:MAG TPA: bacteriohemerythrin [Anaeromyxobacter sp.]|nr:bacteriohemerythrin [Anaeromyxobacter sp.]